MNLFNIPMLSVRAQVLYTGDFSREEDRHLMAAEVPTVAPDVMIMESTYGTHVHEKREDREARFTGTIHHIVTRGGHCLIPVFALGRAQELLLILGLCTWCSGASTVCNVRIVTYMWEEMAGMVVGGDGWDGCGRRWLGWLWEEMAGMVVGGDGWDGCGRRWLGWLWEEMAGMVVGGDGWDGCGRRWLGWLWKEMAGMVVGGDGWDGCGRRWLGWLWEEMAGMVVGGDGWDGCACDQCALECIVKCGLSQRLLTIGSRTRIILTNVRFDGDLDFIVNVLCCSYIVIL